MSCLACIASPPKLPRNYGMNLTRSTTQRILNSRSTMLPNSWNIKWLNGKQCYIRHTLLLVFYGLAEASMKLRKKFKWWKPLRSSLNFQRTLACRWSSVRRWSLWTISQCVIAVEEKHRREKLVMPVEEPNVNTVVSNRINDKEKYKSKIKDISKI